MGLYSGEVLIRWNSATEMWAELKSWDCFQDGEVLSEFFNVNIFLC